ncbi:MULTISPECIES: glycosyltransferase [unclassified Mycobacterium]|uniref:glycosyltransferase n=1 Tax=unclassified Mycobacterium TaxID=2642494 RepID=UPI000800D56D|nr:MULTISPECIES: glycosyltransferase [unclassified Mycobacterium]OBH00417.1 glycosyl transferase family 1 [Mycobacterium sp. E2699]OBI51208.1 glycosyl transferase family 1 [Mycobacterium sp. E787]
MKIAIVTGDDLVDDDPQQLCAALAARGHEATAYVRQQGRRPAKVVRVGPRAVASAAEVLPYVGEWAETLERLWSADAPEVVHAYGWLGGLAAQLAASRQRLPTVQTFLGLAATSRPADGRRECERERIEPLLARGATWVTAECTGDVDVLSRVRRGRSRVSSLCGGVDVERFSPVGPAAARNGLHRILCLAPDPLECNGFDIAIRALPRVMGAELVLAETAAGGPGHDRARAALERVAAESGVSDRVRFAGKVGADDLPALLRSADVVVCTPRRPLRATPALQAMASGVAVVALPVGVLSDAVVDGVTGQLLSRPSPAALAEALRRLLAQSFHCESMGAAGRSRAVSRYTWDRIALDSLNIYRQLGSQRRLPAESQSAGVR